MDLVHFGHSVKHDGSYVRKEASMGVRQRKNVYKHIRVLTKKNKIYLRTDIHIIPYVFC